MPKKIDVMRRALEARRRSEFEVSRETSDAELEKSLVNAMEMRGVSSNVLEQLVNPPSGRFAVWSKTYTENSSSRLANPAGGVIYETKLPLSAEEEELIHRLGLRSEE